MEHFPIFAFATVIPLKAALAQIFMSEILSVFGVLGNIELAYNAEMEQNALEIQEIAALFNVR